METIIELRAAKIPGVIGYIASHYWFVIIRGQQKDRWEIWQNQNVVSSSWGHLHKNLMPYDCGVGNGKSWVEQQWQGETALFLAEIIEQSPQFYPHNYHYIYYPGPNSNTYIQWVLNQSNNDYRLSSKALGKDFLQKTVIKQFLDDLVALF